MSKTSLTFKIECVFFLSARRGGSRVAKRKCKRHAATSTYGEVSGRGAMNGIGGRRRGTTPCIKKKKESKSGEVSMGDPAEGEMGDAAE